MEKSKKTIAVAIIAVALFAIVAVMGKSQPLIPSVQGLFGIPFAVLYLAFLFWYAFHFKIRNGYLWIFAAFVLFFFVGLWEERFLMIFAYSGPSRYIAKAACVAGLVIGFKGLDWRSWRSSE